MRNNIFAFTETNHGAYYPAYVSLNQVAEDAPLPFELTVRSRGEQYGHTIHLSRADVHLLAQSIRAVTATPGVARPEFNPQDFYNK